MGDTIPMNRPPRSSRTTPARRTPSDGGIGILSMRLRRMPLLGGRISFAREDGRWMLVYRQHGNERRHKVPALGGDIREDAVMVRWEESICGGAPTFHNSDPLMLCSETEYIFGYNGWEKCSLAA